MHTVSTFRLYLLRAMVAWPAWRSGHMDDVLAANAVNCLVVVLVPCVLPWRYLIDNYLRKPADAWLTAHAARAPAAH